MSAALAANIEALSHGHALAGACLHIPIAGSLVGALHGQMRCILQYLERRRGHFAMYGFDIMLDQQVFISHHLCRTSLNTFAA